MSGRRVLIGAVVALAWSAPAATASGAASCAGPPTTSALGQYCETIPSATGGRAPLPGSPALAPSLSRGIVHRILRSGPQSTVRKLLRLPAGSARTAPGGTGTADAVALSLPLIVALAAVALALAATAAARRRRRPRPA